MARNALHRDGGGDQRQDDRRRKGRTKMLWTILAVLVILWLLGFLTSVGGAAIHVLLVLALVVFLVDFLRGRSSTV
jgi:hypothetical protein